MKYIAVKTIDQLAASKALCREAEFIIPLYPAMRLESAAGLWIMLPDVLRENKSEEIASLKGLKGIKGFAIQNLDEVSFLKSADYKGGIIGGELLYCYNSEAVKFYQTIFPDMKFIAPAELTDEELFALEKASGVRFIYKVYGRQKLMTTAQVLDGILVDEKKGKYVAVYDKDNALSEIYTGKSVSMLDKKQTYEGRDILIEFTNEDVKETKEVLETMSVSDYIRGHHFKGID